MREDIVVITPTIPKLRETFKVNLKERLLPAVDAWIVANRGR
jgi:hypothetical protein